MAGPNLDLPLFHSAMPKVSVILPTFNRKELLEIAISSALEQTINDFELIVIDDGSTDGTKAMVEGFGERIRYIYQKNKGVSGARNRGIREARGEYLAFLDSDDRWVRDKLKVQVRALEENPEYLISHTEEIWYRRGRLLNPKRIHKKRAGDIFKQSLRLCSVSTSTAVVKRELFSEIGGFDESMPVCEDYDLWLRATAAYPVLLVDRALTLKDGGRPDQLSQQYIGQMDKFRIYAICKLIDDSALNEEKYRSTFEELERKCRIYGNGCLKRGRVEEAEGYLNLPKRYAKRNFGGDEFNRKD